MAVQLPRDCRLSIPVHTDEHRADLHMTEA
jgi:hypothetical protein